MSRTEQLTPLEQILLPLINYPEWNERIARVKITAQQISKLFEFPLEDLREEIAKSLSELVERCHVERDIDFPHEYYVETTTTDIDEVNNQILSKVSAYLATRKLVKLDEDQTLPDVHKFEVIQGETAGAIVDVGSYQSQAQQDMKAAGWVKAHEVKL